VGDTTEPLPISIANAMADAARGLATREGYSGCVLMCLLVCVCVSVCGCGWVWVWVCLCVWMGFIQAACVFKTGCPFHCQFLTTFMGYRACVRVYV